MKKLFITTIFALTAILGSCQSSSELTLEQKAAKMLIIGFKGTTVGDELRYNIVEKGVSGVIFFEHNITPVEQGKNSLTILQNTIKDIQALSDQKLFIAIDQEGGKVNRLKSKYGFKEMASHKDVAAKNDLEYAQNMASTIATEVKRGGFNLNFAPCVDVDVNPKSPAIGNFGRSFSPDENVVAQYAEIYVDAHHKADVLTSLKHFPGHGSAAVDSHLGLTDITNTWSERELTPYRKLIEGGRCDMVMISHLFNEKIDSKYPATLSRTTIDSLLRGELGWDGVIITDDMQMKAITDNYGFEESIQLAVAAGVDLFIVSSFALSKDGDMTLRAINAIVEGVESGRITIEQIDKSIERIENLRGKLVF